VPDAPPPVAARRDPPSVPASELALPDELDYSFAGWQPEAFEILDRLRKEPHIGQYKTERDAGLLDEYIREPFKRYRDDLVVNWVLPNRLGFETEKRVFSRLLKNDFGAGGCHHHRWMAFYRPEAGKRLKDVQLSHSLSDKGLTVGLYVGAYATDLLDQAKERIREEPERYRSLVNALLKRDEGWYFSYHYGSGKSKTAPTYRRPLESLPEDWPRADGIAVRRRLGRDAVRQWQSAVVREALEVVMDVWPLYRFYLA
jgi:hypothetical protein